MLKVVFSRMDYEIPTPKNFENFFEKKLKFRLTTNIF